MSYANSSSEPLGQLETSVGRAKKEVMAQYSAGQLEIAGPQGESFETIVDSFPLEELEQTIGKITNSITFKCRGNCTILKISLESLLDNMFRSLAKVVPGYKPHPIFYRFRGVTLVVSPLVDFTMLKKTPQVSVSILDERIRSHDPQSLDPFKITNVTFGGAEMHGIWVNQRYFVSRADAKAIKVCVQISDTGALREGSDLLQGVVSACVERTHYPTLFVKEKAIAMPIPALKDRASVLDTKALRIAGETLADALRNLKSTSREQQALLDARNCDAGSVIPRSLGGPPQTEGVLSRSSSMRVPAANFTPLGEEPVYGKLKGEEQQVSPWVNKIRGERPQYGGFEAQYGICYADLAWDGEEDLHEGKGFVPEDKEAMAKACKNWFDLGKLRTKQEIYDLVDLCEDVFPELLDFHYLGTTKTVKLVKELPEFMDGFTIYATHCEAKPPEGVDIAKFTMGCEAQMFKAVGKAYATAVELPETAKSTIDSFAGLAKQWETTGANLDSLIELALQSLEETRDRITPVGSMLDAITGMFSSFKNGLVNNSVLKFLNLGEDAWPEILKAFTASIAILVAVAYISGGKLEDGIWKATTFLGIVWSPFIAKIGFNLGAYLFTTCRTAIRSLFEAIQTCFSPPQKVHQGGVSCVAQFGSQKVDLVGHAIRCIVLMLGGVAFYAVHGTAPVDLKREKSLFKKLGDFGRDLGGISFGIKTISEWSVIVSEFLRDWVFDLIGSNDPAVNEMKALMTIDPISWASEIADLYLIENRHLNVGTPSYTAKVRHLYDTGIKLQNFITEHPMPPGFSRRMGKAFDQVTELRNEVTTSFGAHQRRIDPFHVCLFGKPSAGKTFLMDHLLDTVLDYFGEPTIDRKYARSVADKYWSGYHGQTAVTFDDLGAVVHADAPSDITEMLNLCSNEPHMVNMASVEEKGRYFTSKYIFSTTNMKRLDAGAGLREPDAFYRRRKAFVEVVRKSDDKGVFLPRELDFSHLEFTFLRSFPGFEPIPGLEKLSYTTFLEVLLQEMGHYYDDQERSLKGVKDLKGVPPRCFNDLSGGEKPLHYPLVAQAGEEVSPVVEETEDFEDALPVLKLPARDLYSRPINEQAGRFKEKEFSTAYFLRRYVYVPGGNPLDAFRGKEATEMFDKMSWTQQVFISCQAGAINNSIDGLLNQIPDMFARSDLRHAVKNDLIKRHWQGGKEYTADGIPIKPKFFAVGVDGGANPDLQDVCDALHELDAHLLNASLQCRFYEAEVAKFVKEQKEGLAALKASLVQRWMNINPKIRLAIKVVLGSVALVGTCASLKYIYDVLAPAKAIAQPLAPFVPRILPGPFVALATRSQEQTEEIVQVKHLEEVPLEGIVTESAPADLTCDKFPKRKITDKKILAAFPSVPAVAETTTDEQALQLCHTTFADALGIFFVTRGDGTTIYQHCCFLGGTLVLLPAHLFFKMVEGDIISILDLSSETKLRYEPSNLHIPNDNRDVAVYDCGARFTARKFLTKHFITSAEAVKMRPTAGVMLGLTVVADRFSLVMKQVESIQANEITDAKATYLVDGDMPYTLINCWKYRLHTMAGECGSLIVRFDNRVGPKLLGFHVASHMTQHTGYAEIITSEMISGLLSEQNPLRPQFNGIGTDLSVLDIGGVERSHMKKLPENIDFKGALPRYDGVRVPDATSIKPSLLHDAIGPHKTEPCILTPLDPRCPPGFTPVCAGLSKFGEPTLPFRKKDIEVVADAIYMDVKFLDNSIKSRAPLTDLEMINGRDGVPFFDRINMNSSEGWPYLKRRPKNSGMSGKRWMFKESLDSTPDKPIWEIADPELKERIKLREEAGRRGERVESFSTECVKDERVVLPKIYEKPKSRLFTILPVCYNLLVRKYFMDFCVMTMENRATLPPAVGINPFSDEWSSLYHRLRNFAPEGFAGDYKLFDGQADPEIIRAIVIIINKWYGGSKEDSLMRMTLADEISHRYTLGFNAIFEICRGIPSGIPITVIINSYINMFYLRLAWRNLAPPEMQGLSHFKGNVRDIVYGDDNNVAIKPEAIGFYNLSTISSFLLQHGITLTDHHKKFGDEALPKIPVEDFSFLKREFSPHPKNHLLIRCPLVKTSIEEQIHWIRRGGDDNELLCDNIHRSLIEAVQHGEEYFDDLQTRINTACKEWNLPLQTQSFMELDEEWRFMASGLDPLSKGYHLSGPKLERLKARYTPFGAL